jgi:hypothetical protein
MGRFGSSKQKRYASVVHFTSTPVTLQLSFGVGGVALLYNNLGRHTLFEFLDDPHSSKTERRQVSRCGVCCWQRPLVGK